MKNKKKAQVFHFDLYGKRELKYDFLNNNSVKSISWNELDYKEPYYFFVKKDFNEEKGYIQGFKIDELCQIFNNGFQTDRDSLFIDIEKNVLSKRIEKLFSNEYDNLFKTEFNIADSSSYKLTRVIAKNNYSAEHIKKTLYRPFDIRSIYYDTKVISRPAQKVFKHFLNKNIGLIISKQQSTFDFQHILITDIITERCSISLQTKETGYVFPLYLYPEIDSQQAIDGKQERKPNLNKEIVNQIAEKLALRFTAEKEQTEGTLAPIDILDYIYAVLHSPTYREKYKEFLKIDFPRIPYPKDAETFWQLVRFGGELRQIHLLESPVVEKRITTYPQAGDNIVIKPRFENGKVRINDEQYFDNVPEIAWGFYIGGYQPAQKWLKDRKGRKLNFDDILHYQKIIAALSETDTVMKKIDEIDFM